MNYTLKVDEIKRFDVKALSKTCSLAHGILQPNLHIHFMSADWVIVWASTYCFEARCTAIREPGCCPDSYPS